MLQRRYLYNAPTDQPSYRKLQLMNSFMKIWLNKNTSFIPFIISLTVIMQRIRVQIGCILIETYVMIWITVWS